MVRLAVIAYLYRNLDLFEQVLWSMTAEEVDQLLEECPWR